VVVGLLRREDAEQALGQGTHLPER
jgi:hypothetical protein